MNNDLKNLESAWQAWSSPSVESPEEKSLRAWITLKRSDVAKAYGLPIPDPAHDGLIHEGREPWEVAHYALLNEFSSEFVFRIVSGLRFALGGSSIDNATILNQFKFDIALADVERLKAEIKRKNEPNFTMPLWKDLIEYQTGEAA